MPPVRKRTKRFDQTTGTLVKDNSTAAKSSLPPQFSASGRPVRRAATKKPQASEYADSTNAISDTEAEESDVGYESEVPTLKTVSRKRKRTPSPLLVPDRFLGMAERISESPAPTASPIEPAPAARQAGPISLTFNIPLGFQGPLVINLDANDLIKAQQHHGLPTPASTPAPPASRPAPPRKSKDPNSRTVNGKVGFLDLPPEIRNQVYKLAFVKDQRRLDFSLPGNFERSSAFLRTCRQVAHEGSSILYSENEFYFRRNIASRTPLWTTSSREIGFEDVHRFLKMIGPTNTSKLRHLFFLLEDAVPCLNPQFKTAEERRYVHDEHLKAAIRIVADHGRLQTLKLGFFGRRAISESDSVFLNEIKAIKADTVEVLARRCHPDWPRLYNNLQWPKIYFHLALDVKTAVTRKKKFYPPWTEGRHDFYDGYGDEEAKEARMCRDCGDVHV